MKNLLIVVCSCISLFANGGVHLKILNNPQEHSKYYYTKDAYEKSSFDSLCYTTTIKSFLKWYAENYDKVNSIMLVKMPLTNQKEWYKVNFDSVNKYISILRSSNFFTEKYLEDQYKYFQKCNNSYAVSKQNDGPPDGMEFDLLLFTQEPDEILKNYKTLKIVVIATGNNKIKKVKLESIQNNLIFTITSLSGKCLIDDIINIGR